MKDLYNKIEESANYIKSKIKKYENIITYIKDDTSLAKKKKDILNEKIDKLKEMIS